MGPEEVSCEKGRKSAGAFHSRCEAARSCDSAANLYVLRGDNALGPALVNIQAVLFVRSFDLITASNFLHSLFLFINI